jgi:hypothetical protein
MERALERSIELRLNTVADAKSVVFNSRKIEETRQALGLQSIEFLVAQESKAEISAIIYGVFKCRTYTSYVSPKGENVLFHLPHFQEHKQTLPIAQVKESRPETVKISNGNGDRHSEPEKPAKRRGMPKGGWPKKDKPVAPDETISSIHT